MRNPRPEYKPAPRGGKQEYHYAKRGRPRLSKAVQSFPLPKAAVALAELLGRRPRGSSAKKVFERFDSGYLWKWKKGKARPTFDQAALLEELSGGAVRLVDWVVPEAVALLLKELNPQAFKRNKNLGAKQRAQSEDQ
jgi:hypothetical protein